MDPTKSAGRADPSGEEQLKSPGKGKKRARSAKDDEEALSPKIKKAKTVKSATAPANGAPKKAGRKSTTALNEAELVKADAEKPEVQIQESEIALTANPRELSV